MASLDYHIILMTTCQPFIQDQWDDELSPRELVTSTERDINVLTRLYYLRHGFADAHVYLTAPLSKIGFVSLQRINDNKNTSPEELEYLRSSLFLALKGLREQGCSYYITRTLYYILKNQLRPEEARYLAGMEVSASAADESPGLVGEIQSAWVPRIVDISADPAAEELSKLAKEYLTLEFGELSDDGSGYESSLSVAAG
ncbi:hypothetical protein N0V86_008023 [Didymella sp. IMI 355093]|nr:hypothetical protein N0V86_008023 [Didymella sp. IMI 355093]